MGTGTADGVTDLDFAAGRARRRLQDEGADVLAQLEDDAAGTGRPVRVMFHSGRRGAEAAVGDAQVRELAEVAGRDARHGQAVGDLPGGRLGGEGLVDEGDGRSRDGAQLAATAPTAPMPPRPRRTERRDTRDRGGAEGAGTVVGGWEPSERCCSG